MQSTFVNDVKIYNLSSGKSMPEWLSSKKRRAILKSDASLRNRIELIQGLEMPGVSQCVKVSKDGNYLIMTGTYKPRVRCYDTQQLALKFERCFDNEVIKFDTLSDDYSKLLFLQEDRWIEFHNQAGRYHRLRIPKLGSDFGYVPSKCHLLIVGASSQVMSVNLESGKFNESIQTESTALTSVAINPVHELVIVGTNDGHIEAIDPRTSRKVSRTDIALNSVTSDTSVDGLPQVSCLIFRDSLNLAVGTTTGQILLFDIRSSKPIVVKDHFYGLPIKSVEFIGGHGPGSADGYESMDMVASMDSKILKLWSRNDGKPWTAIQTPSDLNDLCIVPGTGLMFLANEDKKLLSYYLPSLGPAPKWCSFLDRIVEETEERDMDKNVIYDDYKFVTMKELEELGLDHLIGTNLLRAYMHGFFMDIRLYHKIKSVSDPVAFEEFKKKKVKAAIDGERVDRVVKIDTLPSVNRDLAVKLLEAQGKKIARADSDSDDNEDAHGEDGQDVDSDDDQGEAVDMATLKGRKRATLKKHLKKMKSKINLKKSNLLTDDRFKDMFSNPDYEIDTKTEEYKLSTMGAVARNQSS